MIVAAGDVLRLDQAPESSGSVTGLACDASDVTGLCHRFGMWCVRCHRFMS